MEPARPLSFGSLARQGGEDVTKAALEKELARVRSEYARDDARGIPMSVRERYERQLAAIRRDLDEAGSEDTVGATSSPARRLEAGGGSGT